ncbi:MAG: signal recognition particle-docking protein FtsY [Pseudomonadota bacterium]|uniref:Signal recognition particle receptor FtsY n=1 Tax=Candidatus Desulfatibia profunda TaxID=2841695 RepID=A0A8J6TKX3_9BACT|nr:signal recognition particle-docking protein FtsY [Candidatus Desulfatibia profunda]MBL7180490.1 signal recognition particle-docking protein FtsY [Desulfobacterales bacterium]MBU0699568.1 signal recognition particle-docking protein FtsY [Pseudomonadota bacterium]
MALNWFKKKRAKTDEKTPPAHTASEKIKTSGEDDNAAEQTADISIRHTEAGKKVPDSQVCTDQEPRQEKSEEPRGFFKRLRLGLSKTRKLLSTDIDELFSGKRKIDDDLLNELEELLITADIGVQTAMDLIQSISKKSSIITDADQLKDVLKEKILLLLDTKAPPPAPLAAKPHVIMVIGVNGVGKTTTIGKLAANYTAAGKKVLIAAADTFRAAAIEQLAIWAQRAGVDIVKHKDKADPAAVAYDGIEAAIARDADIVLVDTAGRLHTRVNLMEELKKIKRTIAKKIPDAPHEILLILDATTGQNALSQAKMFSDALGVTAIALTKLDGTAKGGIVVSICSSLEIPLKYVGIGEKIEDLQEFDPVNFVNALF